MDHFMAMSSSNTSKTKLTEGCFNYVDVENHPMLIIRIDPTEECQKLWNEKKYDESECLYQEQYQKLGQQILKNKDIVERMEKRLSAPHDIQGNHNHCVECKLRRELNKTLGL